MKRNTATVGDYTLTVSMATLYSADKALGAAGKPSVMETFVKFLPAVMGGDLDVSELDVGGLDFESFAICITEFMRPEHKLSLKKSLEGPLNEGSPAEWLGALFNLLLGTSPKSDDALPDDETDGDSEGKLQAA